MATSLVSATLLIMGRHGKELQAAAAVRTSADGSGDNYLLVCDKHEGGIAGVSWAPNPREARPSLLPEEVVVLQGTCR